MTDLNLYAQDIVRRLRGVIVIPVNDGAGLLDGKDTFTRDFGYQGLLQENAAALIEQMLAGYSFTTEEANSMVGQLMEPDDPIGIGKTYVVPIRHKAAQLIILIQQALES